MTNERDPFGAGKSSSRRDFIVAGAAAAGVGAWFFTSRSPAGAALISEPRSHATGAEITLADFTPAGAPAGTVRVTKLVKTDAQWRRQLSPLEYDVLRKFDDEVPFTGAWWKNHEAGIYRCAACDTAVYGSADKFDSGTGWPSFTKPLAESNIHVGPHGALPHAIMCARCESFLGDLFDDGPKPTGMRHCINSASLRFVAANSPRQATAVVAGGCFWGVDAVFKHVRGVTSATSGYAGGAAGTAQYERVSDGDTGHAESVRVTFDPAVVSYETLLKVFFIVAHDPTTLNRQGPDTGTQYRSAIFFADPAQKKAAETMIANLEKVNVFGRKIVTALTPLDRFYPAEAYHQNYLATHLTQPYIVYNDLPKLEALKEEFPELYRDPSASR